MKILKTKKAALSILVIVLLQLFNATVSYAGPLADYATSLRSRGMFASFHNGIYYNENAGYRAGIGGTLIFPAETSTTLTAGFKFDFSSSCMGMNFNAEAFSNISVTKIVTWLKSLLTSPAFIYGLATSVASPEIKAALDSAKDMGLQFTQLLQSPCELGEKLGGDIRGAGGIGAYADCVKQSLSSLGSKDHKTAYEDCVNKPASPTDPSTKKRLLDVCLKQFGMSADEKSLIGSILGTAGYTRSAAGKVDIKGIKPPDTNKDYNDLFKKKEAKFKIIINKILTAPVGTKPTITVADEGELSGPGMSLYASDIRAMRILYQKKPGTAAKMTDALANAMAIGEFKYAIIRLTELISKCQSVDALPDGVRAGLQVISKQINDFLVTLDSSKTDNQVKNNSLDKNLKEAAQEIIDDETNASNLRIKTFGE